MLYHIIMAVSKSLVLLTCFEYFRVAICSTFPISDHWIFYFAPCWILWRVQKYIPLAIRISLNRSRKVKVAELVKTNVNVETFEKQVQFEKSKC